METSNHTGGLEDFYWGCTYNPETDKVTENLNAPLRKDSFQLWQVCPPSLCPPSLCLPVCLSAGGH